jgi:hypothetical protein
MPIIYYDDASLSHYIIKFVLQKVIRVKYEGEVLLIHQVT